MLFASLAIGVLADTYNCLEFVGGWKFCACKTDTGENCGSIILPPKG